MDKPIINYENLIRNDILKTMRHPTTLKTTGRTPHERVAKKLCRCGDTPTQRPILENLFHTGGDSINGRMFFLKKKGGYYGCKNFN